MPEKNKIAAAKAIANAQASLKPPAVQKPQEVINSLMRNSSKQGYIHN